MWQFHNPVRIFFGSGLLNQVGTMIHARHYALLTYGEPLFGALVDKVRLVAGEPAVVIDDISPNPDFLSLPALCDRCRDVDLIVAIGGGSIIDAAKVLSAADGDFSTVSSYLLTGQGAENLSSIPIIAIPTTSGTGSEVTSWATVWHQEVGRKFSLSHKNVYPEIALVDPELTLGLPLALSVSTGLDALSHALESLWNVNRNPVSTAFAISAAKLLLDHLPKLKSHSDELNLRSALALGSLQAGLAFSNTKTALAHSLSYPITLRYGVTHGFACSFTLPMVLRSVIGLDHELDQALREIFGADLHAGADRLNSTLEFLGVGTQPSEFGISESQWLQIIDEAFAADRGKNFLGNKKRFWDVATS